MKNKAQSVVVFALLAALILPQTVLAADQPAYENAFLAQVADPGTLPTSPFYFLKEWGRGVKMFFIFDPAKKAGYELEIIDEKAAEISRIDRSNADDKEKALQKAIDNYEVNVGRLQDRLQKLESSSSSSDIQSLVDDLQGKLQVHQEMFESLKSEYKEALYEIDSLQTELREALVEKAELEKKLEEGIFDTEEEEEGVGEGEDEEESDRASKTKECKEGYVLETDNDGRQRCLPTVYEPEITHFDAYQVNPGDDQYYEFSWASENTEYCTLNDKFQDYFSKNKRRGTTGSVRADLQAGSLDSFHLYCYGQDGNYDYDSLMIEVEATPPEVLYFKATPVKGDYYEFSWSSENTDYCILGDKGTGYLSPHEKRTASDSMRAELDDLTYSKFILTCYNSDGDYDQASVVVEGSEEEPESEPEPEPRITAFKAILVDASTNQYKFTWSSVNTSHCELVSKATNIFSDKKRNPTASKTIKVPHTLSVYLTCYYSDSSYDAESMTISGPSD